MRNPYGLDRATRADLRAIADIEGIPVRRAHELYGWQQMFGDLAAVVRERFPRAVARTGMNPRHLVDRHPCAIIVFKGEVPEEAREMVADFVVPVVLEGGAPYLPDESNALGAIAMRVLLRGLLATDRAWSSRRLIRTRRRPTLGT